jgi:hypothetical protein
LSAGEHRSGVNDVIKRRPLRFCLRSGHGLICGIGSRTGLGRLVEAAPAWNGWREIAGRVSTCRVSRSPTSSRWTGGGS